MPLTISHAAAALPVHWLSKGRLPLAAIMVGSMSPDFAYFLPGDVGRGVTHTLPGVFTFCLPISMLAWLFFVLLLERPTLALLPATWRTKFPASDRIAPRTLLAASLAIVLGAFTHLAWDAFTHSNTSVTHGVPFFHAEVYDGDGYRLPLYRFLQHLSTVVGLAVLARWLSKLLFGRQPVRECIHEALPPTTDTDRLFAVLFIIGMSSLVALVYSALNPTRSIEGELFYVAVGGMTGAALAWTLVAISIGNRSRARRVFIRPGAE